MLAPEGTDTWCCESQLQDVLPRVLAYHTTRDHGIGSHLPVRGHTSTVCVTGLFMSRVPAGLWRLVGC